MSTRVTPAITLQRETLTVALIAEAAPLLEAHWEEIAHFKDVPLNPDYDLYLKMEVLGVVRVFTMRDAGRLTGYIVYLVRPALHYQQSVQATQDILYLNPALRGHMLGARMLQWCDEQLAAEGVDFVHQHVKVAHDFGVLLKRLGYEHVEQLWTRRLERRA